MTRAPQGRRPIAPLTLALLIQGLPVTAQQRVDPRDDWEVPAGFTLGIDTDGWVLPSAIAFVPRPGPGPKDPLYFVTELAGRIAVVTNDRSVYTFARVGTTDRQAGRELPGDRGEHGTAGTCLDAVHGYVFVTFAYDDGEGVRRNSMVRFQARPETFSLAAEGEVHFTEIFADQPSSISHQIGPCQVDGETVFVSVGDGKLGAASQSPGMLVGKILRMTLDGRPVPGNPLYVDDDIRKAQNFVWAMGLRNPFGLRLAAGRLFAADNGEQIDRFIEVQPGVNYLWDGTDASIGTNALTVFSPSVCPVATEYSDPLADIFPAEYEGLFFLALSGSMLSLGPGLSGDRSIVTLDYDMDTGRMRRPPEPFVRYRGSRAQAPVALAFGPDGLFFASILPTASGASPIFSVRYDPANEHPFVIGASDDPGLLIAEKNCRGCHLIDGRGGVVGPSLEKPGLARRLEQRLNSAEYEAQSASVDSSSAEPFASHAGARREVLAATGMDRVRLWVRNRLLEPRFDATDATMPNPGLTPVQADRLADYLLGDSRAPVIAPFINRLRSTLPSPRHRYTVLAFIAGFLVPIGFRRRRRKSAR